MSDSDRKLQELIDARFACVQARDYFGVFGLKSTAEQAAIQKEYFALAKLIHPDKMARTGLDAETRTRANEVFKFVSDAYSILSDPARRQAAIQAMASGTPVASSSGIGNTRNEEAKIYQHKAQRLLQMRGYAQAEHFLRQATKLAPEDAGIMTELGWAVFNNDAHPEAARMEEAHQLWSRARVKAKDDPRAHYYTALYFKALGDLVKARSALEAAVAVKPNYVEAQRELRLLDMREVRGSKGGKKAKGGASSGGGFLEKHVPFLAKLFKGGPKRR